MAEMAVGNRPEFRRGHVDYGPEAPPEVMIISLLAFYLGRALTDSDGYAEIINGALDNTGARYRLQRRGH